MKHSCFGMSREGCTESEYKRKYGESEKEGEAVVNMKLRNIVDELKNFLRRIKTNRNRQKASWSELL